MIWHETRLFRLYNAKCKEKKIRTKKKRRKEMEAMKKLKEFFRDAFETYAAYCAMINGGY